MKMCFPILSNSFLDRAPFRNRNVRFESLSHNVTKAITVTQFLEKSRQDLLKCTWLNDAWFSSNFCQYLFIYLIINE